MLLMYSILNWSSGLASGTGGIKVLIADTIVCKAEVVTKKNKKTKQQALNRINTGGGGSVSSYNNQWNGTAMRFSVTTETLRLFGEWYSWTYHYGILHVFPNVLDFLFLFSTWGQNRRVRQGLRKHVTRGEHRSFISKVDKGYCQVRLDSNTVQVFAGRLCQRKAGDGETQDAVQ